MAMQNEGGTSSDDRNLLWDTGLVEVCSDDPTTDTSCPLTPVVRAVELKEVLSDVWIGAKTKSKVRIGVEFTDNPIDFATSARKELFTGYLTTAGWNFGTSYVDLWSLSGLVPTDYRMYARLVAMVVTTSSSTKFESMRLRARFYGKPITPRTILTPRTLVNTKGLTANAIVPCSGPILTDKVAWHRVMTEVRANTGASISVRWQETNTPDDPMSWTGGAVVGSAITANGMTYPGALVAVAPTKRYMQYCADSVNTSGVNADIEGALVRMTIDQRDR